MGFFSKIKEGLKKTKDSVFGQVHELFKNMRKVDEELLEELEELLIMADVGYASSEKIISELRKAGAKDGDEVCIRDIDFDFID